MHPNNAVHGSGILFRNWPTLGWWLGPQHGTGWHGRASERLDHLDCLHTNTFTCVNIRLVFMACGSCICILLTLGECLGTVGLSASPSRGGRQKAEEIGAQGQTSLRLLSHAHHYMCLFKIDRWLHIISLIGNYER
uniref:Uncharacterized protein n=1 Tax=Rhipicephalus microplus TaxID=6941 RepID=A0A6G5AEN9_RHIMP